LSLLVGDGIRSRGRHGDPGEENRHSRGCRDSPRAPTKLLRARVHNGGEA
jgi:hypothetical protein